MSKLFPIGTILRTSIQRSYRKWIYPVKFCQLYPEAIPTSQNDRVLKVVVLDEPDKNIISKLFNNNEIDKHLTTMTDTNLTTQHLGILKEFVFDQDVDTFVRIEGMVDGRSWDYGAPHDRPTWDTSHLIALNVGFDGDKYVLPNNQRVPLNLKDNYAYTTIKFPESDMPIKIYNNYGFASEDPQVKVIYEPEDKDERVFVTSNSNSGELIEMHQ